MNSFTVTITKCVMCPWRTTCLLGKRRRGEDPIPDDCPRIIADNLRYVLLEALSERDRAVNFIIYHGRPESRKAIGFTDRGWERKKNTVQEEQEKVDRALAQMDSFNIPVEDYTRDRVKDWYSERLDELEKEWENHEEMP